MSVIWRSPFSTGRFRGNSGIGDTAADYAETVSEKLRPDVWEYSTAGRMTKKTRMTDTQRSSPIFRYVLILLAFRLSISSTAPQSTQWVKKRGFFFPHFGHFFAAIILVAYPSGTVVPDLPIKPIYHDDSF
jgi:hypothetical protein